VHALVAPGLCFKVLLGLPWLVHNKIIIDHSTCTAVDKSCGFDILNENCITPSHRTIKIFPEKKRKQIFEFCKLLVTELKLKCAKCLEILMNNDLFEDIKQVNIIAAIKNSIELQYLYLKTT
jgi:hypothetical protein